MIFRKPAVHCTLLTTYGVDLYIIKKENELSDNRQAVEQMKQENVDKMVSKIINDVLRSDCSTEEGKKTIIRKYFETDKKQIVNQDGRLIEEAVKLFKFLGLGTSPKQPGETDLEVDPAETEGDPAETEGDQAETAKESSSKIPNGSRSRETSSPWEEPR